MFKRLGRSGRLRRNAYVGCLCLAAAAIIVTIKIWFDVYHERDFKQDTDMFPYEEYHKVNHDRVKHLHTQCEHKMLLETINRNNTSPNLFKSTKYNALVCKVSKAGSTFWTRIINVLENNDDSIDKTIFDEPRLTMSRKGYKYKIGDHRNEMNISNVVISTRDPFSRLFSAYIDKAYLLSYGPITNSKRKCLFLKESKPGCKNDITFQEFVDCVIEKSKSGDKKDTHWIPINEYCQPCKVDTTLIVKQESFSDDIKYVLHEMHVETKKLEIINEALYGQRIENEIQGMVKTVYKLRIQKYQCISWYEIARRIWKSFQIQGLLNEEAHFPTDKINSIAKTKNITVFSELILHTITLHPLSSTQSKLQRCKALVDAYKGISEETIKDIQREYKADFELFGYTNQPPSTINV